MISVLCFFGCIAKTVLGGGTRGGIGGEGICEGIDASWVTQKKIVCMWWQLFAIRRGKECRDKFVLSEALIVYCVVKRLLYRVWNVGARCV